MMLRGRLWAKIIAAFTAVIILFGLIVVGAGRHVMLQRFSEYTRESDIQLADNIAYFLTQELASIDFRADAASQSGEVNNAEMNTGNDEQSYEEALKEAHDFIREQQEVLDAVESYSAGYAGSIPEEYSGRNGSTSSPLRRGGGNSGRMGMGMDPDMDMDTYMGMNMHMMNPRGRDDAGFILPMRNFAQNPESVQVLITDHEGEILVLSKNTPDYERIAAMSPFDTGNGVPFFVDDYPAGYVFAGTMIDPAFNSMADAFLSSINRTVLIGAAAAFILSILASMLLFGHIVAPVSSLRKAAEEIGRGKYGTEVRVRRRDELGELAASFNVMSKSLEAAEEWKRQIVSDTAHELRTPVSLLLSELEMMEEGIYPTGREQIAHLTEEVSMLSRVIQEMQELSSAESGTVLLHPQQTDMFSCVQEVRKEFQAEAERRNMHLSFGEIVPETAAAVEAEGVLTAYVDKDKIKQVLRNMLSNSFRYAGEQGMIDISLFRLKTEHAWGIGIEDSGPGIAEADRERIFDRFYRVEQDRARDEYGGGSGLGLAISRRIAEMHNGSISAESPLKFGGARFVLRVPMS